MFDNNRIPLSKIVGDLIQYWFYKIKYPFVLRTNLPVVYPLESIRYEQQIKGITIIDQVIQWSRLTFITICKTYFRIS